MLINDCHIADNKLTQFTDNMDEALDICIQNNVKYLLIGGDLFEARASQPLSVLITVKKVLEKFTKNNISVIMVNGNHDKVNQESNYGYCHVFNTIDGVTVIDEFGLIETPNANIFMLAYFPEIGSLKDKVKAIEETDEFSNGKVNILYAHAGVLEALGTKNKNEINAKTFSKFNNVYMGHYHNRSKFGKNIEYIGSSRQFSYGEDEEKGYNICNSYGELTFIKNKVNDRYITIQHSFKKINELPDVVNKILNNNDEVKYNIRCIIKATKTTKDSVDVDKIQKMGIDKVIVETNERKVESESSTLYEKLDTEQIKIAYSEFCSEIKESDNLGLQYLSKINVNLN